MKNKLLKVLSVVLVIISIVIGFLPNLNNYYYQKKSNIIIAEYASYSNDKTLNEIWEKACDFNMRSQKAISSDAFGVENDYSKEYMSMLNVNGIMGYITIPSIDVQLPIYHGTSSKVLNRGIGHLPQSSLPVGGKGSHCVLTGHTGIEAAKMFNELTELKKGDMFSLTIAGHELSYEVDNIAVVLPENIELLQKVPEKDYCTLVTCTPYGVNTHRLLVRGVRLDTHTSKNTQILEHPKDYTLIQLVVTIALAMLFLCIVWRRYEKKND